MRGKRGTDITPTVEQMQDILANVGCTKGWKLTQVYDSYFEIRAPHPNGKESWWEGVADLHTSKAVAQAFFAALVLAGRNTHEVP